MTTQFSAEVFQNAYLAEGTQEVHAIMTITATGTEPIRAPGARPTGTLAGQSVFGMICDVSGSMGGGPIQAAKAAIIQLIQMLPETAYFFVVTGSSRAQVLVSLKQALPWEKERAIALVKSIKANGGTVMSSWLSAALEQFQTMPNAIRQAILLTDGQNDPSDEDKLEVILKQCEGQFQCNCRGVGTDWRVSELKKIAQALLGTTDIIPDASQIAADFQSMLSTALTKQVSNVALRLWRPQGATIQFCKQMSPEIVDLSDRAKTLSPQIMDYPTGAWAKDESRDYHFCIVVKSGNVGDEMLAGRASLICTIDGVETKVAEAKILAIWTDDEVQSAKIDRHVAHYTGQAELAESIQEGLAARQRGDIEVATAKLGRAVKLAHAAGNDATIKLISKVADIEDAPTGTIRINRNTSKADDMALETRSTKTTRIARGS
jgi:uncharacterized protein YegL